MSYQNIAEVITETDRSKSADLHDPAAVKSETVTISEMTSSSSEINQIALARGYLQKGILDKAHRLTAEFIEVSLEPDALIKAAIISFELGKIKLALKALDKAREHGRGISTEYEEIARPLYRWFGREKKCADPGINRHNILLKKPPSLAETYCVIGIFAAECNYERLALKNLETAQFIDAEVFNSFDLPKDSISAHLIDCILSIRKNPYLTDLARGTPAFQQPQLPIFEVINPPELNYRDQNAHFAIAHLYGQASDDIVQWAMTAQSLYASAAIREAITAFERVVELQPNNDLATRALWHLPKLDNSELDRLLSVRFDANKMEQLREKYYAARQADFYYNIDIVGTCNLRCPSCPVGNYDNNGIPKGFMELDKYEKILAKIKRSHDRSVSIAIDIHNWGESLLHPKLPEFIKKTREYGFLVGLSSNLNHNLSRKKLTEIIEAGPDALRISLSGFSNETHMQTHTRGDINIVKSNMHLLRHVLDSTKSKTAIEIGYMVYKHNFSDDFVRMRLLAEELDFHFDWIFAVYMPVEKTITAIRGEYDQADKEIFENLPVDPREWTELVDSSGAFRKNSPGDCHLKKHRMAINFDGTVPICCASYSYDNITVKDFLKVSHEEIQKCRSDHSLCGDCMESNAYFFYSGVHPEMGERRAYKTLSQIGAFVGKDGR
tara:strand:+ start:750 stop:2753 length:2004 start_codon:yes stop_codon:yes gene_type:complete